MPYADPERQKKAQRDWYLKNRQLAIAKSVERARANRRWLAELKQQPCADCGGTFHPVCMDFHHCDEKTKIMNVTKALVMRGRQFVLDEIAKCELVCANCHRLRTWIVDDTAAIV